MSDSTTFTEKKLDSKSNLVQAEEDLAKFAAGIDSVLRKHFATRTMRKLLYPASKDENGNIVDNDINVWLPAKGTPFLVLLVFFLATSMLSFLKFQPLIEGVSFFIAIYFGLKFEKKLLPKMYFSDLTFHLMRLESRKEAEDFPDTYVYAHAPINKSGFDYALWKTARGVELGHLLVCVHDAAHAGLAIIHLQTDGKLSVTSWRRDLFKKDILPPIHDEIKELALAFDTECDKFVKISKKLENFRALSGNSGIPEVNDLTEIWKRVTINQEVKEKLISLATHFAEGSSAASRGLLLYGPPGTGKTLIAKNLAESMGCAFYPLSLPDLKAGYIGHSGEKVKELWAKALEQHRAVIFIDECEGVFSRRGSVNTDSFSEEIVQAFLAQWDGFSKQTTVWVVGATNRRDLIDPAILSRFGEEIEIGLPGAKERLEILTNELKNKGNESLLPADSVDLTQGLSGRDLENLAGRIARELSGKELTSEILAKFTESYRKQGSTQTDENASWENLILENSVLKDLKITAGMLKNAESFTRKGINVPRGLLLYGPPGTGKTQIARTLANETGLRFIGASTADMKAGFVGQSGKLVKELFERARESAPCLLFIDELDIVTPVRGAGGDTFTQEIIGQMLQEMDGIKSQPQHVFVLAATNRLDQIDSAVLSRFSKRIEIPNPDADARHRLLQAMLKGKPLSFDLERDTLVLAEQSDGMSGRDLRSWIEQAENRAVGRAIENADPDSTSIVLSDFDL